MRARLKQFIVTTFLLGAILLPSGAAPRKGDKKKEDMEAKKRMSVPAGKPEIFELAPRGIQRGLPAEINLIGTNLTELTGLLLSDPKVKGEFIRENERTATNAWVKITAAADLMRGAYEVSVKNTNSESSKLKIYVDDLPVVYESKTNRSRVLKLPVSFWGTLNPRGDEDDILFEARAGNWWCSISLAKALDRR